MTTPIQSAVIWATLKVQAEGFTFAPVTATNGTTTIQNTRLTLPRGVNLVLVDWMGQSRVLVQAGVPAVMQKVEVAAATSGTKRSVALTVPVDSPDAYVSVTTYKNAAAEVGQVMGGIRVFPTI